MLAQLSVGVKSDTDNQAAQIENIMNMVGLHADDDEPDGTVPDWHALLQEAQELQETKELSHAELNAKRKQLTFKSFADPELVAKVQILQCMVGPNVLLMDTLFKRSRHITSLHHIPAHETARREELAGRPGRSGLKRVTGQVSNIH